MAMSTLYTAEAHAPTPQLVRSPQVSPTHPALQDTTGYMPNTNAPGQRCCMQLVEVTPTRGREGTNETVDSTTTHWMHRVFPQGASSAPPTPHAPCAQLVKSRCSWNCGHQQAYCTNCTAVSQSGSMHACTQQHEVRLEQLQERRWVGHAWW